MSDALGDYLKAVTEALRRGDATEHTHRPALQALVQSLLSGVTATNEPKHIACGAPDFIVSRRSGSSGQSHLLMGYIETKDVGKSLDDEERSEQLKRYLHSLGNLILTDYLEFRWYVNGEHRQSERLARVDANGKLVASKDGAQKVGQLLLSFLDQKPEPIGRPKDLALRMARLTHLIRDIIVQAFEKHQQSDLMSDLHRAFQETLVPDLPVDQFADMFAQTLAYGLFSARVMDPTPGDFSRAEAQRLIPKTNPFLRKLFAMISGIEMDEEPFADFVDDLVQVLAQADILAILADFGKRERKSDPIVHFYETFLAAYDPKLRESRGVYYTPEPVVSYIVRSVDYLLKERFGLSGGLADESTVSYNTTGEDGKERTQTSPRVLVLDPACGTGTFLYTVIDLIRERFVQSGNAGMWSGYVQKQLLPRLFGFELLMAPYAVAHFKLGLQLAGHDLPEAQRKQWAYDFSGNERLGVYLTNSLEKAEEKTMTLFGPLRMITEEANAAARVKRDLPIMVVMGNPPYANFGRMNRNPWILSLLDDYKKDLHEKKLNLDDDFIKFIRFAQWRIEQTGAGILAYISSNAYLDGLTHRRMRESLIETFSDIYILNLHGNIRKKERCPDGSGDENVFDIQQGVAIGVFVKETGKNGPATVHHADMWGSRESKYARLMEASVGSVQWNRLRHLQPHYFFVPTSQGAIQEYEQYPALEDVFPVFGSGLNTDRDALCIDVERASLEHRMARLFSGDFDEVFRQSFNIHPSSSYDVGERAKVGKYNPACIRTCIYRPYDFRSIYYQVGFTSRPVFDVHGHMLLVNLGLLTARQSKEPFAALCTRHIATHKIVTVYDRSYLAPVYLYPIADGRQSAQRSFVEAERWPAGPGGRRPNLTPTFVADVEKRLGLAFTPDGVGDLQTTFGPEDVFHYMYAVFHSPTYRSRYAEFLKMDFPRLPVTNDVALFRALAALGQELVALHLMDSPALGQLVTNYPVVGNNLVDKGYPRYLAPGEPEPGAGTPLAQGRVYINKEQYVAGVSPDVWEFHIGGYQVCDKWLKDRRGRTLSYDDRTQYQKIVVALKETVRLMAAIDAAIPEWPLPGA